MDSLSLIQHRYMWLKKGIAKNRLRNVDLMNSVLSDKDGVGGIPLKSEEEIKNVVKFK